MTIEESGRMSALRSIGACIERAPASFSGTQVRDGDVVIDDLEPPEFSVRLGQGGTSWFLRIPAAWGDSVAEKGLAVVDGCVVLSVVASSSDGQPLRVIAARWFYDDYEPWFGVLAATATIVHVGGRLRLLWDDEEPFAPPASNPPDWDVLSRPALDLRELPEVPLPSAQLQQTLSWRVATEIARHLPDALRILERHPGEGLYDTLSIEPTDSLADVAAIHLNRFGSAHVFTAGVDSWRHFWNDAAATDDLQAVVAELCQRARIPRGSPLPPTSARTAVYRFIATLLSQAVGTRSLWECRNGVSQIDDNLNDDRRPWFAVFPGARAHDRRVEGFNLGPEYEYWFILRSGEPLLCLHEDGTIFDRSGAEHDLLRCYRHAGSRIWPVVFELAGEFLE